MLKIYKTNVHGKITYLCVNKYFALTWRPTSIKLNFNFIFNFSYFHNNKAEIL